MKHYDVNTYMLYIEYVFASRSLDVGPSPFPFPLHPSYTCLPRCHPHAPPTYLIRNHPPLGRH